MTTAVPPGQPTAPITLGDDPAATTDRILAAAVAVDGALLTEVAGDAGRYCEAPRAADLTWIYAGLPLVKSRCD